MAGEGLIRLRLETSQNDKDKLQLRTILVADKAKRDSLISSLPQPIRKPIVSLCNAVDQGIDRILYGKKSERDLVIDDKIVTGYRRNTGTLKTENLKLKTRKGGLTGIIADVMSKITYAMAAIVKAIEKTTGKDLSASITKLEKNARAYADTSYIKQDGKWVNAEKSRLAAAVRNHSPQRRFY